MDVFQILIFLVVIGLGVFKAARKNRLQTIRRRVVRKSVPADSFPVDKEDEGEPMAVEMQMTPSPEVGKAKHSVRQERPARKEGKEKRVPGPVKASEEKLSEYAFRTPSDARRAFIYSEIFRRKYD